MNKNITSQEAITFTALFNMFKLKNILKTALITSLSIALAMIYLYFATPHYISSVSVEVDATATNPNNPRGDDLISSLHQPTAMDIETEMDVIKSDTLIAKALERVTDYIKYYDFNGLKKRNYYTDTPFLVNHVKVTNRNIFSKVFIIKPIDKVHFLLGSKQSLLGKIKTFLGIQKPYFKRYKFSTLIKNKNYQFVIENYTMEIGKRYAFQIMYPSSMVHETQRNINVKSASARSSVIEISYEDTNPYRVRDFLTCLMKEYIEQNIDNKAKNASKTLLFLKKQIHSIKKELLKSADLLKEYKKSNNFLDLNEKSRTVLERLVNNEATMQESLMELEELKILEKEILHGNYSVLSSSQEAYPALVALVGDLQTVLSERATLSTTLTKLHPDYIAVQQRIKSIEQGIRQLLNTLRKSLEDKIAKLQVIILKENKNLASYPDKEQKLANYERIYTVNERLLSYLMQREAELGLKASSKISDIRALSTATLELKPAKPNKKVVLSIAIFLGLLLSFLASLLKFHTKIRTVDDIKESNIPLFGIIPYVKDKGNYNKAYVLEDQSSTASEAFRAIRTNLDYMVTDKKSKVILVTSSIPNEGKTVVSANLAAMIGLGEKKVILLGLDLRRPGLHYKFGIPNKFGISDILANKISVKEAIWEHEKYPNLNIITSGKIPPNPAELLASSRLQVLIEELQKEYDYIILDTPPVNYVADALVLFKYSDINLFVVKSDFTDVNYLKELESLVEKYHIENSGIILNSVKSKYNKLEQFDNKYLYFEPLK